jgi:2-methylcitrate dehydratase PrpD
MAACSTQWQKACGCRKRRDSHSGLFPAIKRAIVRITTADGATHEEQVDHAKGRPQNPMRDDEVVAKFSANAAEMLTPERQAHVIEATWGLEHFADIGEYMWLLVGDR